MGHILTLAVNGHKLICTERRGRAWEEAHILTLNEGSRHPGKVIGTQDVKKT